MEIKAKLAAAIAALVLIAVPTAAIADGAPCETEKPKAYGVHGRGFSKRHSKGRKGTLFLRCLVAAAQVKKQTA